VPDASRREAFGRAYPDALLFTFPKRGAALARDFKWTGSHRYAIVHLGGRDREDLRARAEHASGLLGWPAPYADLVFGAAVGRGTTGRPAPDLV
jgi:hypothetical protein